MKPVDLTPSRAAGEAVTTTGGPSASVIGMGVAAALLVLAVSAYFAMARVNTIKEETAAATKAAADASSQDTQIQAQIKELGQKPVKEGWKTVADAFEGKVISQVQNRADYTLLARDLRIILPNTSTGLTKIQAGSDAVDQGSSQPGTTAPTSIKIEGLAPDVESINTLLANIDSTPTMEGATIVTITSAKVKGKSKLWRKFSITANLSIGGGGADPSAGGDPNAQTVSTGGTTLDLATDPPAPKKAAAAKPAPPPDSLAGLLNDTASLGGAK